MAQYVESSRLWPLLAYFVGAVIVVLLIDVVGGLMEVGSGARLALVLAWIVLLPAGAWWVWKRTENRSGPQGTE